MMERLLDFGVGVTLPVSLPPDSKRFSFGDSQRTYLNSNRLDLNSNPVDFLDWNRGDASFAFLVSELTNHPGYLWRDKWTALSGPLSCPTMPPFPA